MGRPLVVDVCSVKVHAKTTMLALLPDSCDILCTHPMFGPESGKHGWGGLNFVYERVRVKASEKCEDHLRWWGEQGCRMLDMTCSQLGASSSRTLQAACWIASVFGAHQSTQRD